ncbi:hypothetical protein [Geomesophilobacter sediminis]|uniref:Uncharacterized protein n=1 Tax=Geomesophilobacter sediminis TaxID=2798584 RepID=A0A8J7M1Q0_9BACT|nr:hypothetical protein [Geomesophilobacter sediminis]MBJ6726883.1 hypothetical protein [Geomesophilobacter sediminis]
MHETNVGQGSYSFQGEYREGLGENYVVSTHYLNEGHVPDHHRDGFAPIMLWRRENLQDRSLSLSLGIGPYLFADTTTGANGSVHNDHGVGAIAGASAIWYTKSQFLVQARVNLIQTAGSMNDVIALIGVGYQLDQPDSCGPLPRPPKHRKQKTDHEITLFLGQTVVNRPGSPKSLATDVEYRYTILPYLDMSASWLHESDDRVTRRDGIITQAWLVRGFCTDHLALGIGLGPYFAVNERSGPLLIDRRFGGIVSPMLSFTATLRNFEFNPDLSARISLNRLVTNYDRDMDTFLLGIGYRF